MQYKVIKQYTFASTNTHTSNGILKVGDIVNGEKSTLEVNGLGSGAPYFVVLTFNPPRQLDTADKSNTIINTIVPETCLQADDSNASLADQITSIPAIAPYKKLIVALAVAGIIIALSILIFKP